MQKLSVIILLLSALTSLTANSADQPDVQMNAIKVSDHVWYVMGIPGTAIENEGFVSNSGFILTGEGVVVFDSLGTPVLSSMLLKEIRKLTDKPVKFVIVSHYHADHIYGLQVFKDEGAEIIAPIGAINILLLTQPIAACGSAAAAWLPGLTTRQNLSPLTVILKCRKNSSLGKWNLPSLHWVRHIRKGI